GGSERKFRSVYNKGNYFSFFDSEIEKSRYKWFHQSEHSYVAMGKRNIDYSRNTSSASLEKANMSDTNSDSDKELTQPEISAKALEKTAQQEETDDSCSETSVHIESDSDLELDEPVQQQPASEDATCLFCDSLSLIKNAPCDKVLQHALMQNQEKCKLQHYGCINIQQMGINIVVGKPVQKTNEDGLKILNT
ncbi:hypothetical protein C0J52_22221, partial [Blattella germanica]